jgi:hypothetical protein
MWYGVFLTIGLILLAFGVYRFKKSIDFMKSGRCVSATVAELVSYKNSDGDVLYRPIFSYTVDGKELKYKSPVGSRPPSWEIGEITTFVVSPYDPKKLIVLTYFGAFGWSVVMTAIGLPLVVIGAGYFWANDFIQRLTSSPQ